MITINNKKLLELLLPAWRISEQATEIKIDFREKNIRLYNNGEFVGNYNLFIERLTALQDCINIL